MAKELYNSVVSKIAIRVPMFAKAIVDKALSRVGANPYTVTPSQMKQAIEEHVTPMLHAFLKPAERVRHLGSGLVAVDAEDRLIQASPAARGMLGLPATRELSEGDILSRAREAGAIVAVADFATYGEDVLVREIQPGGGRILNVAMTLTRDLQGSVTGLVALLQDVTLTDHLEREVDALFSELERKNASLHRSQEKLEFYVAELEEATRLKSRLLANVSHELRTPLNAIIGFTDVVLNGLDGPISPGQRESLEWVAKNSRHLLALINDLLDMARIEAGKLEIHREPVDLAELVHAVTATLSILAREKAIGLDSLVAHDVPLLQTDRTRLRQILLNLISNAIKFTSAGGVSLSAARDGADRVAIQVKDSGSGIPGHQLASIWSEFHQAVPVEMRDGSGSGLGLSISKRLAEMLGGSLAVESTVGVGSTFTLLLPVARERRSGAIPPVAGSHAT